MSNGESVFFRNRPQTLISSIKHGYIFFQRSSVTVVTGDMHSNRLKYGSDVAYRHSKNKKKQKDFIKLDAQQ